MMPEQPLCWFPLVNKSLPCAAIGDRFPSPSFPSMPTGYGPSTLCRFLTLLSFLTLFQWFQPVLAVQQNITIDDQGEDAFGNLVVYAPMQAWANQSCNGCAIDPDPNMLHARTATSATFMPENFNNNTLDFDFNGTAIYVYFTLFYNEGNQITVNTECNFTVDNGDRVFFNHSGDPTRAQGSRDYNSLVYSRTDLTPGKHHMTISMSDVSYHVFLSFDYALYTVDIPPVISGGPSSVTPSATMSTPADMQSVQSTSPSTTTISKQPSPVSPGIIAGGIVGGFVIIAGFIAILYYYRRDVKRTRRPSSPGPTVPRPFVVANPPPKRDPSEASSRYPAHHGNSSTSGSSRNGGPASTVSSGSRSTSAPLLGIHENIAMTSQSSSSGSGSASGQVSVERQIQAATQRMRSLREEIASNSGRRRRSRRTNSSVPRGTQELIDEVKRLRREIQSLKEVRRAPAGTSQPHPNEPPPYSDGSVV